MSKIKSILFYVLSFTWGIIMSLIGCIVFLALMIVGYRPKRFYDRLYIEVGNNWGGVELGPWFLTDKSVGLHTRQHESGHGFQNTILGPFMPFVVCIPSAVRYWLREFRTSKGRLLYSIILTTILFLIGIALLILGIGFHIVWLAILGGAFTAYVLILGTWLIFIERPKYKENSWPKYDDIWFEHQASEWGAKVFPEEYSQK